MQKILNKREKTIFLATILVIVFAIVFNIFISPILAKNEDLNRKINFTRAKFKKYILLLSQKESIQAKYSKYSSAFAVADQQAGALVSVLTEIENLAEKANIHIVDIRPQAPRGGGAYKEIVVDLRAEGSMEGYMKFIYNIEQSVSSLAIRKFQINAKPSIDALEGTFTISKAAVSE